MMSGVLGHPEIAVHEWATGDDCGVFVRFSGGGLNVVLAPFEARRLADQLVECAAAAEVLKARPITEPDRDDTHTMGHTE